MSGRSVFRSAARAVGLALVLVSSSPIHAYANFPPPAGMVDPATVPPPVPCPGCWEPELNTSWQIQLQGAIDQSFDVAMYEIDMFENETNGVVASLQAGGSQVLCYVSAGSWENWRDDATSFPDSVKGKSNGWPGERWLDIRQLGILGPILEARMDRCRAAGFDGIDFDNVEGYANDTGFPLSADDQLAFNIFLANEAHERGLSVALKNDLGQIPALVAYFDLAVNEQCFQYRECELLLPFVQAGKPVFQIEYRGKPAKFCPQANAMNFNALKKKLSLGSFRIACR